MEVEGGCYCGAVRYRAEGEVVVKGQCFCRECQYIAGGMPNVVMGMPASDFAYTKGAGKPFRRKDLAHPVTREFCAECGTHLLTRAPGLADVVLIKVGTLDDPSVFGGPQLVTYTVEKQSFHHVPAGIPAYERFPS
jgi:hypothetical protein